MATLDRARGFVLLAFFSSFLPTACGDDDAAVAAVGAGQRGESCRARSDCGQGLACIAHVCEKQDFHPAPTTKECVAVECRVAEDCCPTPSSSCSSLEAACAAGDTFSCSQFDLLCKCDVENLLCEADRCYERCTTSSDCLSGTACVESKCVGCATDDDCSVSLGQVCKDQQCVTGCDDSDDCAAFFECADSACVERGCANNRECVADTGNVLAFCQDQHCRVPCASDVECDLPDDYHHLACVSGYCVDVGCESDEECRIRLSAQVASGFEAVCREATTR